MSNMITMALGLGALSLGAFYFFGVDKVNDEDVRTQVERQITMSQFESIDSKFDRVSRAVESSERNETRAKRSTPRKTEISTESCRVGPIELGAEVHFVDAYEGNALSNIDITQGQSATEIATVQIDDGDTPLVIVAGSYTPLIWNFTGATERISTVVLSPNKPGLTVGAIGIAPHQLKTLDAGCLPYQGGEKKVRKQWEARTGLSPYTIQSVYSVNRLSLPSGDNLRNSDARRLRETEINTKQFRYNKVRIDMRENDHDVFRFHPEGVYILDEKDIIATGPVNKVKLLPGRAGIAQLVSSKKIVLKDGVYHVRKKFPEYPVGLYGSHLVKFIFPDRMKLPSNSPGHSKVIRKSDYEAKKTR